MSPHPPTFSPEIERRHRRIDADDWDDIFVVGDVHGCKAALDALLAELDPGPEDLVVFVGDLIRKGPDSHGVVRLFAEHENFHGVRGNNEDKVIRGKKTVSDLTDADLDVVESMPLAISFDDALVVHGGIDPRKPLGEQTEGDLLTVRSLSPDGGYSRPYWFEQYEGPPRVFFGHTVLERPAVREWSVGLDTGCVYGGSLTAYDYRADEFVAVPLPRGGKGRKDGKIVTPRTGGPSPTE